MDKNLLKNQNIGLKPLSVLSHVVNAELLVFSLKFGTLGSKKVVANKKINLLHSYFTFVESFERIILSSKIQKFN
ncbi:hypothetical protein BpHYR1_002821 [Brachionus plicatilis]|uniref:Uncharacterized protein n=1 Tax=Brachionus plicatilis TaxID=10195 RepID=A0A3M7R269_BRAPC|nr:hypothetical protein BpHYR1_002821 [Brachionus plicatilis]